MSFENDALGKDYRGAGTSIPMTLLTVDSVSKHFRCGGALRDSLMRRPNRSTVALNSVSMEIARGETVAVLGPNGSGKTTLFKIIAGMLIPDAGTVSFSETSSIAVLRRGISMAVASERSFFPRLTARENLDYFASLENIPRRQRPEDIDRVLEIVRLTSQQDLYVQRFSSGMYQRMAIARALLRKPAVLLLDEPTRSLDPAATESFWGWIRESASAQAATVIATHSFEEASAVADRAIFLCEGRIVGSRPIRDCKDLRDTYFASTAEVCRSAVAGSA